MKKTKGENLFELCLPIPQSVKATVRHYSHYSYYSLFATIRCSLFATIRYSLFGFSRHPADLHEFVFVNVNVHFFNIMHYHTAPIAFFMLGTLMPSRTLKLS